jgi:nucleotide-binding universal stress UspA family protein
LEIIHEVVRSKDELVVITAAGELRLKDTLCGDTSIHLLRKCPCPVWIVKPLHSRFYNRILAAVDAHTYDHERNTLNIKVMEAAASLARLEQSEIYVVHTWIAPGTLRFGSELSQEGKEPVVSDAREARVAWLKELVRICPLEAVRYQVHLLEGEPAKAIPALAKRKRVDVIVMGTVSRTGLAALFIGNMAEKVLRQVDCSVLTVKPDALVTPVRVEQLESVEAA